MGAPARQLCEDFFGMAHDEFESLIEFLKSGEARELSHTTLEGVLQERGRELLRQLLQAHLDQRGPGVAAGPVRDATGREREEGRTQDRSLSTLVGEVRVRRLGYGTPGEASLHPLDAELNLPPEQYSLGMRRLAAQEAAKGSFEEAQASVTAQTGTTIPKRQLEQLVTRAAQDFDEFYAQRVPPAGAGGQILVITTDGKGVVMRREDLRAATRREASRSHRLEWRLSKGEKRNRKRIATVAAVYTIAAFPREPEDVLRLLGSDPKPDVSPRPRPEGKRVWASLEKEPQDVLAQAFAEAKRRDPTHTRKWVALVDGQEAQLRNLRQRIRELKVDVTIVLDLMHVCEYLWDACTGFHDERDIRRESWVAERLLRILRGESSLVAAGIRASATKRRLPPEKRVAADRCCNYLLKNRPFLRYDAYLRAGYPIATGVIEGACRHLVKDRMDVTGARWSLKGAEAVLRLRALRSSGDFAEYWVLHEQREYQRNHVAHYADGNVAPVRGRYPRKVK